jgi:hypothetical protein
MKKQNLKSLNLRKRAISNLEINGGAQHQNQQQQQQGSSVKVPVEKTDLKDCHTQQDESMCWE